MSVENDFLPFAVGAGANVLSQAAYAAMTALGTGFQAGTAQSAALNKVWRQSSIMSAVLAQFIVAQTGQPAIDDGTTSTLLTNLQAAITSMFEGELGSLKGVYSFAASITLTPDMVGSLIDFYGGSPATFQLPEQILLVKGNLFVISNSGSATLTVTCPGDNSFAGGMSSIPVQPNESLAVVVSNATGQFIPAWGAAVLQYSPSFLASLTTNGYQQLPGGQIRQWGFATTGAGGLATITFLKPFPNACLNAHATNSMSGSTPPSTFMGVGTLTKTTMLVGAGNGASGVAFYWEATGN